VLVVVKNDEQTDDRLIFHQFFNETTNVTDLDVYLQQEQDEIQI
jgi:hypothetical protein